MSILTAYLRGLDEMAPISRYQVQRRGFSQLQDQTRLRSHFCQKVSHVGTCWVIKEAPPCSTLRPISKKYFKSASAWYSCNDTFRLHPVLRVPDSYHHTYLVLLCPLCVLGIMSSIMIWRIVVDESHSERLTSLHRISRPPSHFKCYHSKMGMYLKLERILLFEVHTTQN